MGGEIKQWVEKEGDSRRKSRERLTCRGKGGKKGAGNRAGDSGAIRGAIQL